MMPLTRSLLPAALIVLLLTSAVGLAIARSWLPTDLNAEWQIVFRSYDAYNQTGVFVMNADGSNIRQLVVNRQKVENYACAPGGQFIVVTAPRLHVVALDGEPVPLGGRVFPPLVFFGIDGAGRQVAYTDPDPRGDGELVHVDTGSASEHALTDNDAYDDMPALSPDGHRLAYVSQARGQADRSLILADATGRAARRVVPRGIFPAWSPDGTTLAFQVWEYNNHDLYMIDLARGFTRQLTRETGQESYPAWSPDGNWLAFATSESGSGARVAIMRPDGSGRRVLNADLPLVATAPCWLAARPPALLLE